MMEPVDKIDHEIKIALMRIAVKALKQYYLLADIRERLLPIFDEVAKRLDDD